MSSICATLGIIKAILFGILFYIPFVAVLIYLYRENSFFTLSITTVPIFLAIRHGVKSKLQVLKEHKYIKKTNPYIYYRELPNNFGIGVTSILFDSTIENHKDIIAVILDLCAKKYINLTKQNDKYVIKILKNLDNNLLYNEKYILYLLINNNIKNVDYNEWFSYCLQDSITLGLFYPQKHQEFQYNSILNLSYHYSKITSNNLRKTKKGINELYKLYSFKALLNDFGNFVSKNVEEVVLWDRYLSYAQVFGLTKK